MPFRVQLACGHLLWPTGSISRYVVGATAQCDTCRTSRSISEAGETSW